MCGTLSGFGASLPPERQAWQGWDEYSWLSGLLPERSTWGNQGFCKSMSGPDDIANPESLREIEGNNSGL